MGKVNVDPLNYVNVSDGAKFSNSPDYPSSPASVDAIAAKLADPKITGLVLYFHGGVVDEDDAAQDAKNMADLLALAGSTKQAVSIIWETSLWETLRDKLEDVLGYRDVEAMIENVFSYIGKIIGVDDKGQLRAAAFVAPATIKAELQKDRPFEQYESAFAAAFRGPDRQRYMEAVRGNYRQFAAQLASDPDIKDILTAAQAHVTQPGAKLRLLRRESAADFSIDGLSLGWFGVAIRVATRFYEGHDHGITCTIMEEVLRNYHFDAVGVFMWSAMKDKAADMFMPNTGPITQDSRAAAYLLDKVKALCATKKDFTIDLVCHSAGSYCIGGLLQQNSANGYQLPLRHIVLMAPACRADFGTQVYCNLSHTYEDLRMFALHDTLECDDNVEGVYPHSLLYLVSGLCEDDDGDTPIMGMERYIEWASPYQTPNLDALHQFLYATGANRLVLATTGNSAPAGMQCDSKHHKGFPWNPLMKGSLQTILR